MHPLGGPEMCRVVIATVATALLVACASCSQAGDPSSGEPSPRSVSTAGTPAAIPAYLQAYTDDERAAYRDAVADYQVFLIKDDMFLKEGRLTSRANSFYRRYSTNWVDQWAALSQLVNSGARVRGHTKELSVRPSSIHLYPNGTGSVTLRRCLDQSDIKVVQDGKPLAQPQLRHPHLYRVFMSLRKGETWWRAGMPKQGVEC
jgi:hypothetical protein